MIGHTLLAAAAVAATFQGYRTPQGPPTSEPSQGVPAEAPAAKPVEQVIPTSPPGRALKDLPNATVRYYDVTAKNLKDVVTFLNENRPKDASGQPRTAATNWSVKTAYTKQTDGKGGCKIVNPKATVTASADLPRLADERSFKKQDMNAWQAYLGSLETAAAAKLWFVNDHISEVEKAMLASSCDAVEGAANAAIQQIRTQSNQLAAAR